MTPELESRLKAASAPERDLAIREAYAAGASYREIARIVGLTHPGVRKIIKRGDQRGAIE